MPTLRTAVVHLDFLFIYVVVQKPTGLSSVTSGMRYRAHTVSHHVFTLTYSAHQHDCLISNIISAAIIMILIMSITSVTDARGVTEQQL